MDRARQYAPLPDALSADAVEPRELEFSSPRAEGGAVDVSVETPAPAPIPARRQVVFEQAGSLGMKMGYRDEMGMSPGGGEHGIPHPEITEIIPGGMAAGKDLRLWMTLQELNG